MAIVDKSFSMLYIVVPIVYNISYTLVVAMVDNIVFDVVHFLCQSCITSFSMLYTFCGNDV